MTGCAHVRLELGGYVLGGLEPAEAEAVREHLARCAACAAEHAELAGLPRLLALAEGAEDAAPLPAAVEERVLDAVARERGPARRRRRPRWRPALALAAGVAAIAAALAIVLDGDQQHGGYRLALRPAAAGAAVSGRAELQSTPGGTAVHLWVRGLPRDPDVVYEVRCDARHWSASAGTFRADAQGRAVVVLTTAARRGEYDAIRVVRRSRGSATDILTAHL